MAISRFFAWLLVRALQSLSRPGLRRLGHFLGGVVYALGIRRKVTLENLARALPEVSEAERRQITLVCCRLTITRSAGGTPNLEQLDEHLHAQHAVFAEVAGRNGGHLASLIGDRVILAFGYPQAYEDDARRAARTALQIAAEISRSSARLGHARKRDFSHRRPLPNGTRRLSHHFSG